MIEEEDKKGIETRRAVASSFLGILIGLAPYAYYFLFGKELIAKNIVIGLLFILMIFLRMIIGVAGIVITVVEGGFLNRTDHDKSINWLIVLATSAVEVSLILLPLYLIWLTIEKLIELYVTP